MIKRIGHFINIILLSLTVLTIGSCDRHGTAWNEMDKAENLMDAKPDSALVVLENIPASSVKGKEAAARYALLKSIALDKNYIDTTNFDVLQPAIDYYIKNGKPDEKLRTYYYQGRIYQNQGDDDSAMRSFMNGCDLRHGVTDSLLLAHTLVAQGTLYFKQYKINDFVHYNMEAARLYEAIGKDILAIKSYTNALDGYVMQNNKPAADSLIIAVRHACIAEDGMVDAAAQRLRDAGISLEVHVSHPQRNDVITRRRVPLVRVGATAAGRFREVVNHNYIIFL